MENSLNINEFCFRKIEVDFGTVKLLVEKRNIKTIGVESGYIATFENRSERFCNLSECRAGRNIFVGDVVHGCGLSRNMHLRIDTTGFRYFLSVGSDFNKRYFDYTVLSDVGAGCFEVEEYKRSLKIEFH